MDRKFAVVIALLVVVLAERGAEWVYHVGWRAGWHDAIQVMQASPASPEGSL
jgi:hypothetical protein